MFTIKITIENLLRFHEHFDNKTISMKNFPLDFEKIRSTHISCGFFTQMWKDFTWKRKDRANFLCHLESCHVASECPVRSRSPRLKNVIGVAQMDPGFVQVLKNHESP